MLPPRVLQLMPKILRPDFTWPARKNAKLLTDLPPTPKPSHPVVTRFWGYVHFVLMKISQIYCGWWGINLVHTLHELPFGLVLKWRNKLRLEEIMTTKACRAAGLPAPWILCYGCHSDNPRGEYSMLMVRLPGKQINKLWFDLDQEAKDTMATEVKKYLSIIRGWKNPWSKDRICSFLGTEIRSHRVPFYRMGPFEDLDEMHDYLLQHYYHIDEAEQDRCLPIALKLRGLNKKKPELKFTHGDLSYHNLLIDERGHVTGFIDWECSGWLPEYWEYATAYNWPFGIFVGFSRDIILSFGADEWAEECEYDEALWHVTDFLFEKDRVWALRKLVYSKERLAERAAAKRAEA